MIDVRNMTKKYGKLAANGTENRQVTDIIFNEYSPEVPHKWGMNGEQKFGIIDL